MEMYWCATAPGRDACPRSTRVVRDRVSQAPLDGHGHRGSHRAHLTGSAVTRQLDEQLCIVMLHRVSKLSAKKLEAFCRYDQDTAADGGCVYRSSSAVRAPCAL